MTFDIENPGPGLGQTQQFDWSPTLFHIAWHWCHLEQEMPTLPGHPSSPTVFARGFVVLNL